MSELDYELASMPSTGEEAMFSEQSKIASPEIIDLCQTDESDIERMDTNEELKVEVDPKPNETCSDLEEGEIKEPVEECNNNSVICKYFRRGICYLRENCPSLHPGVDSSIMFKSNIINPPSLVCKPLPVYNPPEISHFAQQPPDSWDKGLEEAKKLVLRAKRKRETDLDFEEKQLYQGLDEDKIIESGHKRKIDLPVRLEKRKGTPLRKNPSLRGKPQKAIHCSRTPENSKWRSNRSDLWSSCQNRSLSPNSDSTSTCSECAALYCSGKSANHYWKTKSKLEKAFSRALDTPETSRSRKKLSSRRTFPSYPRKRSLSKSSFIKRFIYRSNSKSPSKKVNSEKQLKKRLAHKQPISLPDAWRKQTSLYSEKRRDSSPFSKLLSENNNDWLESFSSDMTVSSLKCSSLSHVSSEEIKPSKLLKLPMVGSRKVSNDREYNVNSKKEGESSHNINEWLKRVPKPGKGRKEFNSEILKKTGDNTKKSLKIPPENKITPSQCSRKLSSWSSSEDELSANELALLKYTPSKNKKLNQRENNRKETKPTVKPPVKPIPPKVVCDFKSGGGSIPTKFVNNCEPDQENVKSPKTHNAQNMDAHDISGENGSIKESIATQTEADSTLLQNSESITLEKCPPIEILVDVDETLSKQSGQEELKQNSSSSKRKRSSSESSSVGRRYSADELELLKYVSIGKPTVSKIIKKQSLKNPPTLATKKTGQAKKSSSVGGKPSRYKSAGQEKEDRTTHMSRREQLTKQLEAVELAIARKMLLLNRIGER